MRRCFCLFAVMLAVGSLMGCGKSPNYFPGSEQYEEHVGKVSISPEEAYELAYAKAKSDNRLHLVSRRPTVMVKNWYVFSMPQGSGASLEGYHVNAESGVVKYVDDKRTVTNR